MSVGSVARETVLVMPAHPTITIARYAGPRSLAADICRLHLDIRRGQEVDGENLFADIHNSQPDLGDIEGAYLACGGTFLVATDTATGEVVGFVGLKRLSGNDGAVKRLAVVRSHRRRGLGTALVSAAVAWARNAGCARLRLATGRRERALGIYLAAGFTMTGEDEEHDDLVMELVL